jgi:hypothetical protein
MKIKSKGENMLYKKINLLGLVMAGLFLFGCATAKGKPFQALQPIPADKGVLYVYNDPAHRCPSEVMINDSAVGHLRGGDYAAFLCRPGPLTVSTGWETEINSALLNIAPGSQSFVSVDCRYRVGRALLSLGFAPDKFDIKPKLVSEQEGLAQIQKWGLVEASHGLASELSGNVTPGSDLALFKTLYVDVGEKGWETPPFIVSGLSARGYTVKSGAAENMPADTECLVKPVEKWFWDLGTYLLELNVEFLNPQTKAVYATAKVRRAIPQGRRGPKIMATEALNAIFNHGMPEGVEGVR